MMILFFDLLGETRRRCGTHRSFGWNRRDLHPWLLRHAGLLERRGTDEEGHRGRWLVQDRV